jgi:hypothetical protein
MKNVRTGITPHELPTNATPPTRVFVLHLCIQVDVPFRVQEYKRGSVGHHKLSPQDEARASRLSYPELPTVSAMFLHAGHRHSPVGTVSSGGSRQNPW